MVARGLVVIAAFLALVYVVDDPTVRDRLTGATARDPLDEVTLYYATRLKNARSRSSTTTP